MEMSTKLPGLQPGTAHRPVLTDRQMTTNVAWHIKPVKVCGQRNSSGPNIVGNLFSADKS